jgi:DegV family protein with EDD domain
MSPIKIVTDTAADLPPELAASLEITEVPLIVTFGERSMPETELSRDRFWELAEGPEHPKTSQPPIGAFQSVFRQLVDLGHEVICFTVTGRHSGTYNSAWAAAQPFAGCVRVVDSLQLSMAQGLQVLQAARLALHGLDVPAILETIESLRRRTHVLIQLDTTEFLRRGGRASRLMPVIDRLAQALHLKPILTLVEGELRLLAVARTRRNSIERMVQHIRQLGALEALQVMHIRCPELAARFADELASRTGFARERIGIGEAGAVLACHGGKGVLGVVGITRT